MTVPLEMKFKIADKLIYISFSVIFGKDYGSYVYDWKINRVTSDNQSISFDHMDVQYKVAIESAIEDRLYNFPFHNFNVENG